MISPGLPPSVSEVRRWIRSGQPYCLVEKSGSQSINSASTTAVTFQTDLDDDWGMHDTSSNTERITIPVAGRYLIHGELSWEINATGQRRLILQTVGSLNKTMSETLHGGAGSGLQLRQQALAVNPLVAGDYVYIDANQNSGGALNIEANTTLTQLMVVRVG